MEEKIAYSNSCEECESYGPGKSCCCEDCLLKVKDINNISEEEIASQGEIEWSIFCENCGYETGEMKIESAVFKINMQGGYFMYDGTGGRVTKCPNCKEDSLIGWI